MQEEKRTFHLICETDGIVLIDLFYSQTQLSKQKLKLALKNGAVWLKNEHGIARVRKAKKRLKTSNELFLYYDPTILKAQPNAPTLVLDEQDYSIWIKPYGMYCQGSKWGDHFTINRWVENHLQRPTFIVHRLDRATSGLMILVHSKKMAQYFSAQFASHTIEKHYRAWVQGNFPKEEQIYQEDVNAKQALSIANLVRFNQQKNQSLVNVQIKTGRKHQIRVHLSNAGFPIIGDRLYGIEDKILDLQLCCYHLIFTCPLSNKRANFTHKECLE
jgi:tRNA pseudouridine32 synthase/23S rRNA pseudouridine746 synthase